MKHNSSAEMAPRWCRSDNTDGRGGRRRHNISSLLGHVAVSLLLPLLALLPAAAWADDDTQSYDTLFHYEVTSTTSLSTTAISATYGTIAASGSLDVGTYTTNSTDYYGIKLDGSGKYVVINLASGYTLQEGDSIIMYACGSSLGLSLALCTTATYSDTITTTSTANKATSPVYYTIPSGSSLIGLSTIYVFYADSNVYFCGATIIRAKSETTSTSATWTVSPETGTLTSPLTTITLTSSDSISAVNKADSCTVTITKDGASVDNVTPTLSLGDASDDGHCYTATVSFGDGIETNGSYTITIPAGALMTITEKATSSDGSSESEEEPTTTAEGEDDETTTDKVEYDTTFSEKIELTYTISIADPTVTVARQVSTAKSLAEGDTLLVLTFDQTVTKAASATATLTSSNTSDETSYTVSLTLTTDGDSAVVTLGTAISTDATYTLTISSGAFTTTNWSSDALSYTITVSSKETFYLVADDDNAQTEGITISPASGTTSLTLDSIVITLPADVTYTGGDNAITAGNATATVSTGDTSLTIALSGITAGRTITITIPAGAITYISEGITYTNAAATLTYTVPAVTVVDPTESSTRTWDFDDTSWQSFSLTSSSSYTSDDGLTVYAGSSDVKVSSSTVTIEGTSHSYYLNLGGAGSWSDDGTFSKYGVSFQVTGPCTIYVGACFSSSSDADTRTLVLSDSSGTQLTTFTTTQTATEFSYSYTGSSGSLYLYSSSSSQRIYYITIVYATSTALDFKAITPDPAVTQQSMSSIQLTYDNSILYAGQGDSGISVTKKTGTTEETVTSSYTITSSDDNAYHYLTVSFDNITYEEEDTTYVTLSIPEKTFCGSDYVSTAAVDTTFTIAKAYLVPTAVTPESGTTTSLLSSVVLTFDSLAYYDSNAGTITVTRSDKETVSNISVSPATSADADTTITISFDKIETEDITVTVTIPAGCLTTAAGTTNKKLTYTYTIQEETETKDYSWNFSNWTATSDYTSGTTTDGLTITSSSTIKINTSNATVGGTSYTQRLQLPNGGTMTFSVDKQCIITVVAKGPNSTTDVDYVLLLGSDTIGTATAYGSTATSSTHYCSGSGTVTISNQTGNTVNFYEIYLTYIDGLALTNVVPEDNSTVESLSKIYIYYDEAIQLTDQPRATYRVDGTLTGTYGTDVTLQVSSSNNQCLVATVPTTAAESGKTKTAKLTIRSYSVANSDSTSLNEDPIVLDYTLQFLPLNIVEVSPDTTTNPSFVKYVYVTYDSENDLTLNSSKSVSVTVNGSPYTGTVETSVSGKKLKIALSNKVNTNGDVVVITLPDSIVSDNNESFNTEDSLTYTINAYGELCSFYFTTSLSSESNTTGISEDDTSTDAVANGCTGYWSSISLTDTLTYSGMKYYKFKSDNSFVKIETDGGLQAGDSIVVYIASTDKDRNIVLCTKVNGDSTAVVTTSTTTAGVGFVLSTKLTSAMLSDGSLTLYRGGTHSSTIRFHGITIYRLGITDPSVTIETDYTERYVNESVEITSELTDFDSEDETYQWYSFHGTDSTAYAPTAIDGAISPNYSYTAETDNDTTSYVVKVTYTTESGTDTTLVSNVLTIITSGYAKPVINTYISGALTEADGENNDTTTYVTSQSAFTVIITSRVSSDNVTYYYKTSTTGFDTEYADNDGWTKGDTISMSVSTTEITYLSVAAVYGSGDDQVVTYSFALYVPSGGSWSYDDSNVITVLYTDLDDMDSAPLGVKLTYTLSETAYNANSWGLMTLSIEDDYENAGYYYSNIVTLDADTVIAEIEGTTYITVTLADVTGCTAAGSPYEITVYANMEPEIVITAVTDSDGTHTSGLGSYYTINSDSTTYTMTSGVTAVKFKIIMPTRITSSTTNTDTYHIFYTINAPHPTWDTTTEGDKSVYYGSYSTSGGYSYSSSGQEISRSLTSYVKAVYYKAETVSDDSVTYSKPSNTQLAAFVMPSNYVMTLQVGDSLRAGAEWFITNAKTQQYYWSGTTSATNPKASETTSETTSETSETESCDTLLRVTWGGTGDHYNKKGIWKEIREDTKSMMSSQIGDYYVDCEGNKDAYNEPNTATVDGSTFTNIYKNGTASVFYSDTLINPNTFDIPVTGSYMKIEPRQDGEVSVIIRQNGIITESTDNFPKNLRKRKIYVSDETGAPLDSTLTAFISPDALQESAIYNTYKSAGWDSLTTNDADNLPFYQMLAYYRWKRGQGNTDVPPAVSDSAEWTDAEKLAAAKFWFGTIDGKQIADSTKTSQLIGGSYTNQTRKDSCAMYQKSHNELYKDNKGWLLMSRAFVRYSFPVEAGKAYFLSGNTTKIGPCAVEFHPRRSGNTYTNFTSGRLLTLSDSTETTKASTSLPAAITPTSTDNSDNTYAYGQSKFQLLNRTFYKNGWTSIVLPFSVNTELLERTFGDSTLVVHYNGHDSSTLLLCQHYHQMIVAGTPVFIRPSLRFWTRDSKGDSLLITKDTLYNVIFDGISYGTPTYETDSNDEWQISNQTTPSSTVDSKRSGDYTMNGSYFQSSLKAGCYVLGFKVDGESNSASKASFYSVANGYVLGGCRAWLEPTSSSSVKLTSVSFNGVTDFDDDETTGIIGIMTDDGTTSASRTTSAAYNDNVYNVNGQLVRTADQGTDGLPAGIYIVNGKKVIIK